MERYVPYAAIQREQFIAALAVAFPISDTRFALLNDEMKKHLTGMRPENRRAAWSAVACAFRTQFEAEQSWSPIPQYVVPSAGATGSRRKERVKRDRPALDSWATLTDVKTG